MVAPEEVLDGLYVNSREMPDVETDRDSCAYKLARLNMLRQGFELLDTAFLGMKITDGDLKLKGLVYKREESAFSEVSLPF